MPNRDEFPICPDCAVALQAHGRRVSCDQCGGTLVTEAELLDLLCELDPQHPRALASPHVEHPSRRRCPRCQMVMLGVRMEGVPVERCLAHGTWFDHGELAKVLAPDADAEEFALENQLRQDAADRFELGALGVVIRGIYRAMRAHLHLRHRAAKVGKTDPDQADPT